MALFEVSRYLGEDDGDNKKQEASSILNQLKQQAKARKKSLGKGSKIKDSDKPELKKEESSPTKFTESADVLQDNDVLGSEILDEELPSKKKKKKRKHEKSETSQLLENNDDIEDVSDVKKAKVELDESVDDSETVKHKKSEKHKTHKKHESFDDITEKGESSNDYEHIEEADDSDEGKQTDDEMGSFENKNDDSKNEIGGFTVIGKVRPTKAVKVHRVLPDWLSNPSIISADLTSDKLPIADMPGLTEDIVSKLSENGITHFFPVQKQVIPALLESSLTGFQTGRAGYRPSDVCVSAPTGSGKTLAFVLPIVQALRTRVTCEIRALAVLPVKDLATQVFKVFQTYCKGTNLKVGLLSGQKTFSTEQHSVVKKRLVGYHSMYDIVVATPGRLVDHINQTEGFNLGHLRYLVIDEADRMMDEVKQDWLIQVEAAVFTHRPKPGHLTASSCMAMEMPLQKLLYSATLSQNPEKLQQLNLFQPKLFTSVVKQNRGKETKSSTAKNKPKSEVDASKASSHDTEANKSYDAHDDDDDDNNDGDNDDVDTKTEEMKEEEEINSDDLVGKYATPSSLSEYYIQTYSSQKPLIILHMLHHLKYRNIICFTNSVETTHRLCMLIKLYGGIEVKELSSSVQGARREDDLKKFRSGKIDILVCSDSMARGMDISNINHVISYDPPLYIQTYVHRIGRTARAGKEGTAFTLLQNKEFFHFKKMMKQAGKGKLKPLMISKADVKPLVPKYEEILKQLGDKLKNDKTKKRYTAKKLNKTEIKSNTG